MAEWRVIAVNEIERLAHARRDGAELRRRWTATSAELQEVTTLLAAAIERVADLIAEQER